MRDAGLEEQFLLLDAAGGRRLELGLLDVFRLGDVTDAVDDADVNGRGWQIVRSAVGGKGVEEGVGCGVGGLAVTAVRAAGDG